MHLPLLDTVLQIKIFYLGNLIKFAKQLVQHVHQLSRRTVAGQLCESHNVSVQNAGDRKTNSSFRQLLQQLKGCKCEGNFVYQYNMPDVSVPLDIKVVEIVCVFHLAKVWTLQSLDDLCFHHPGNMSRQQGQQETLLTANKWRKGEM